MRIHNASVGFTVCTVYDILCLRPLDLSEKTLLLHSSTILKYFNLIKLFFSSKEDWLKGHGEGSYCFFGSRPFIKIIHVRAYSKIWAVAFQTRKSLHAAGEVTDNR